jgi:hypothetical protein
MKAANLGGTSILTPISGCIVPYAEFITTIFMLGNVTNAYNIHMRAIGNPTWTTTLAYKPDFPSILFPVIRFDYASSPINSTFKIISSCQWMSLAFQISPSLQHLPR